MRLSSANPSNAALIEEYHARWQKDPASVDEKWAAFFEGFALGCATPPRQAANGTAPASSGDGKAGAADLDRQTRVDELVQTYRSLGHTLAKLDPLENHNADQPLLALEAFGFAEADLDQVVSSRYFMGGKSMRLREMIAVLQRVYSGKIGVEFMHIASTKVRNWVRDRVEAWPETPAPEPAAQRAISATCSRRRRSSGFCTRATSARSGFRSKAARRFCRCWKRSSNAARRSASANSSWAWPTAAGSTCWRISSRSLWG